MSEPASFWWGNIRRMARERVPVIQGFSEHVIPTLPEWGEHVHTTGYWLLDESDWRPPIDLMTFFDAGEAPVFVGFGSMPVPDSQATTTLILDALGQSGQRGILHAGWAKLGVQPTSQTPFSRWSTPHTAGFFHAWRL